MKKRTFIIPLVISISTAMGCVNSSEEVVMKEVDAEMIGQEKQSKVIEDISVEKFANLIEKEEGQIVDVRTPAEWEKGTIEGAEKINFYDSNFLEQLAKLDKEKPVYVYCKMGGRSSKAAKKMQELGFKKVYNLLGGFTAWNAAQK